MQTTVSDRERAESTFLAQKQSKREELDAAIRQVGFDAGFDAAMTLVADKLGVVVDVSSLRHSTTRTIAYDTFERKRRLEAIARQS